MGKRHYKIELSDDQSVSITIRNLTGVWSALESLMEELGRNEGQIYTVSIVAMDDDEFSNLPEWDD